MTMAARPTDQQILEAVRQWGNRSMTYAVTNRLNMTRRRDAALTTAQVHRHLICLEAKGCVKRVETSYKVQHCWSARDA